MLIIMLGVGMIFSGTRQKNFAGAGLLLAHLKITMSWVTAGSGVPGSLLAGLLESCQILLAS